MNRTASANGAASFVMALLQTIGARSHATTLLLAGVPVHIVAACFSHTDPAVTLRVYSHVRREHAVSVGDIFAQAVKDPTYRIR